MNTRKGKTQILLFVLISYAHLWVLFGVGRLFEIPFSYDPRQLGGKLVVVGIPASTIAAVVVTLVTRGSEGLGRLFKRSLAWRFSPLWYLAAVAIPLAVTLVSALVAVAVAGAALPARWFSPSFGFGYLAFLFVYVGFGEEIGWRGLALPQLQERWGSLGGSIVGGVLWALWHLPLFLMPSSSQYGNSLVLFIYLLICWTIVMALLVHKARGSVLVAILFHGAVNFVAFAVRYPHTYVYLVWGAAALVAAVFLPKPLVRIPWDDDAGGKNDGNQDI